jgi:hypothetical protein
MQQTAALAEQVFPKAEAQRDALARRGFLNP